MNDDKEMAELDAWIKSLDGRELRRHKALLGQCAFCDDQRVAGNDFHPSHDASKHCESGKRNHCSCDTCF